MTDIRLPGLYARTEYLIEQAARLQDERDRVLDEYWLRVQEIQDIVLEEADRGEA